MNASDPRAVMGEVYRAWMERDWESLAAVFSPDAVLEFTGRSPFAGTHRGPDAAAAALRAVVDRTQGTFRAAMPDTWDILSSDDHTVLVDVYQAEGGGQSLRCYILLLAHVGPEGIERMFTYFEDQYTFDDFFS